MEEEQILPPLALSCSCFLPSACQCSPPDIECIQWMPIEESVMESGW